MLARRDASTSSSTPTASPSSSRCARTRSSTCSTQFLHYETDTAPARRARRCSTTSGRSWPCTTPAFRGRTSTANSLAVGRHASGRPNGRGAASTGWPTRACGSAASCARFASQPLTGRAAAELRAAGLRPARAPSAAAAPARSRRLAAGAGGERPSAGHRAHRGRCRCTSASRVGGRRAAARSRRRPPAAARRSAAGRVDDRRGPPQPTLRDARARAAGAAVLRRGGRRRPRATRYYARHRRGALTPQLYRALSELLERRPHAQPALQADAARLPVGRPAPRRQAAQHLLGQDVRAGGVHPRGLRIEQRADRAPAGAVRARGGARPRAARRPRSTRSRRRCPSTASTSCRSPGSPSTSRCAATCTTCSPASRAATASAATSPTSTSRTSRRRVRDDCGKREADGFEPARARGRSRGRRSTSCSATPG